jgi:DNA polymerase I-like protein with 3'-5' exonuclease and polymerase domains
MEWNGIKYNFEEAKKKSQLCKLKLREIISKLQKGYEEIPIDWNSRDHLSCFLYGGTIIHESRMPVGIYVSGQKCGLPRFKIIRTEFKLPRLVDPIKNSELKKPGYFSTAEETLQQLKSKKEVKEKIILLLEKAELEKLVNTYYDGLQSLKEQQEWDDYLYGQYNQVVAATGRLSSSKPNQQNFAEQVKELIITRYDS